ncbi:hypothetical protein [Nitrosarchaeum sp.]|uniref:hypothetical protein n=1 Tax=Nitrosarchaeum sp. TaxID=2026886 RepID=UPI00247C7805|nr:hypothetical protein [Nitrosarchaeum sp.]MCV0412390.1 hypothetical protein [Nitrosarchaeum sp.]
MTQAESGVIALYGDSPRMKMINFFMTFPKNEFTVPELVEGIGMSRTTAFNEIKKLSDNEMIINSGNVGKSPTYKINIKSPIVYSMQKLVSLRSKKIAASQVRNETLNKLLRTQLRLADELYDREAMLKTELKLTREMINEIPA